MIETILSAFSVILAIGVFSFGAFYVYAMWREAFGSKKRNHSK